MLPASNPFSTRFVRAGCLAFVWPDGTAAQTLIERFLNGERRAEIVGPHGSGKTTALDALQAAAFRAGRTVMRISLHDGASRWAPPASEAGALPSDGLVFVDGYEQLSRFSRLRCQRFCNSGTRRLLATAHGTVGFPSLLTTETSAALACLLADNLLGPNRTIGPADVRAAWQGCGGNLREAWFQLYDLYEARRPQMRGG